MQKQNPSPSELVQHRPIVITEPLDPDSKSELQNRANVIEINPAITEGEFIALAGPAIAIINRKARISKEVIRHAPHLKIIARMGVGVDNTRVDLDEASRRNILITATPGINSVPVAEHTFSLILTLTRKVLKASLAIHAMDRDYFRDAEARRSLEGTELAGKTIGIIGLGHIGRRVATYAAAFGMHILAFDPYVGVDVARNVSAELVDLNTLLSRSDVITIHTTFTKDTRHLLNMDNLKLMKGNAILVNTSRGGVVDEDALCRILEDQRIAGAALDVFENEPLERDSSLLSLPNVVLTPHIAGLTEENFKRSCRAAVDEVLRVLGGLAPRNLVGYS